MKIKFQEVNKVLEVRDCNDVKNSPKKINQIYTKKKEVYTTFVDLKPVYDWKNKQFFQILNNRTKPKDKETKTCKKYYNYMMILHAKLQT